MAPLFLVDPALKVTMDARPSNYEVTHISWDRPVSNLNWYRYVLVRNPKGYPQTPDDGDVIFPNYSSTWSTNPSVTSLPSIGFTDDVVLRVTGTSTGGVVTSASVIEKGASAGIAVTSVSPVSSSGIIGKGVVVSIDSSGVLTVNSGGGNYVVGDIVRIPGNSLKDPTGVSTATLPGVTSSTQLGVSNTFHIYDNGPTYATTVNPGTTSGTNPYNKNYNKYYYSLFAYVAPSTSSSTPPTIASFVTRANAKQTVAFVGWKWIKLGETSSVVVHQNTIRNTKDVLLDHLPVFYSNKNNANQNKDLSDFLSLFAFHLDVYLAKTKSVFTMSDVDTTDEVLLKQFLNQYGSELTKITDLAQARKVLANIIRNYSLQGSTLGLKNLIEAYTGSATKQVQGINILPDYNTSSFVEGIGKWYPIVNDSLKSCDSDFPYKYTLDPIDAASKGASPTKAMVAQLYDASLVGTTNVNISPNASFFGKLAYITNTSGSTLTNNYEVLLTVTASTPTTSTTVKVNDTSKLKLGSMPLIINQGATVTSAVASSGVVTYTANNSFVAGQIVTITGITGGGSILNLSNQTISSATSTEFVINAAVPNGGTGPQSATANIVSGVFSPQTVITYIDKDGVTFKVNIPPSTAIAVSDKIAISNTITSGILSLRPAVSSGTGTLAFYSGTRNGLTSDTSSVSNTGSQYLSAVVPNVARIGDYVIGDSSIPLGTKVLGFGSTATQGILISKPLTGSVVSAKVLSFSSTPNRSLAASIDMIPVLPNTPYAFGAHFNANGGTTKTTSVSLTWYDINGNSISGTEITNTSPAPSSSSPYTNSDFAKTWYPTYVQGISPSNAVYVSPKFSVLDAAASSRYCMDSAMLVRPISIIKKSRTSNVATLTTDVPHNFFYDSSLGGGKVAVVIPDDSSFNATNATITNVVQDIHGNYTFSYSNSGSNVVATSTVGYVASFPMTKLVSGANISQLTAFQDARETTLEVIAQRVNLIPNPSFEYDSGFSVYDWSPNGSATNPVVYSSSPTYTGSNYLLVDKDVSSGFEVCGITSGFIAVTAGKTYSASCVVRNTNTRTIKIGIAWYTSLSSGATNVDGTSVAEGSSIWTQIKAEGLVAPAGTTYAKIYIQTTTTTKSATSFAVDGVLFEESDKVLPYFDGDFDGYNYDSYRNSMWQGTPGQSKSHLYTNLRSDMDTIDSLAVRGINYA